MFGGDSTLQIIIKAVDQATGVFKSVETSVKKSQQSFADTAAASQKFAIGLGVAATAAGGLGYAALKAAGDMEQTTVAFTTMLGSGEKAQQFIAQLVQFAKTTPFTLTGLQDASKQLLAYGIVQEKVIPDLTALGNIAAGVGMDKLPFLITAFGQVSAKTRLMGSELLQFTNAGVPLLDMLAKQFHKSVPEIQDMISAGQVGFPAVEAALNSLSGEGGRFNNLMEKQSHTLQGMLSNLQDAWNIFLMGEGKKLLDWAKNFTSAAIYIVQNVLPIWVEKISVIVDWFGKHRQAIGIIVGAITGMLVPAIIALSLAFAAAALALAPWAIGGALIAGLVEGIIWVVKSWGAISGSIIKIWDDFGRKISDTWAGITGAIADAGTAIGQSVTRAWNVVTQAVVNAVDTIKTKIDEIIQATLAWTGRHQIAIGLIVGALSGLLALAFMPLITYVLSTAIPAFASFSVMVVTETIPAIVGFSVAIITRTIPALTLLALKFLSETIPALAAFVLKLTVDVMRAIGLFAVTLITETIPAVATFAARLAVDSYAAIVTFATSLAVTTSGALVAFAIAIWTEVIPAVLAFAAVLLANPITAFLAIGLAVGGLVALIATHWDQLTQFTTSLWVNIKKVFSEGVNFLIGLAEGWGNAWVDAANVIIRALNKIHFSLPDWIPGIGGKSFGIDIAEAPHVSLPRLEFGGVVPGAVGTAVPIIAHGGETVLPANAMNRGGGITYQVIIQSPRVRSHADVDYMRQQIEEALRDVTRGHKLATS